MWACREQESCYFVYSSKLLRFSAEADTDADIIAGAYAHFSNDSLQIITVVYAAAAPNKYVCMCVTLKRMTLLLFFSTSKVFHSLIGRRPIYRFYPHHIDPTSPPCHTNDCWAVEHTVSYGCKSTPHSIRFCNSFIALLHTPFFPAIVLFFARAFLFCSTHYFILLISLLCCFVVRVRHCHFSERT